MAKFIKDLRKDLKAPDLPFVIGVLGVGGPADKSGPKAAMKGFSNQGYHYLGSAKIMGCIGKKFAEAMASMVKGE